MACMCVDMYAYKLIHTKFVNLLQIYVKMKVTVHRFLFLPFLITNLLPNYKVRNVGQFSGF